VSGRPGRRRAAPPLEGGSSRLRMPRRERRPRLRQPHGSIEVGYLSSRDAFPASPRESPGGKRSGRSKRHFCLEGRIVCLSHRDHFIPYLLEDMAGLDAPKSPVQFLGTTSFGPRLGNPIDTCVHNHAGGLLMLPAGLQLRDDEPLLLLIRFGQALIGEDLEILVQRIKAKRLKLGPDHADKLFPRIDPGKNVIASSQIGLIH